MAVDFSHLTRRPAGEAKRPAILPPGDYPGVIKTFEFGDRNQNQTPYVRFHLGLANWAEGTPDSWNVYDVELKKELTFTKTEVDLSKRQMRRDFFLTEDAFYRLDDLIRSCGIEPQGRSYEEILPELRGQSVLIEVQQYINNQTSAVGNQVGKLAGTAGG